MHKGCIVSISGNTIVMSHDDGSPNDTHSVAADATVTLNNKAAKLADLKAGDCVCLSGEPATTVAATR